MDFDSECNMYTTDLPELHNETILATEQIQANARRFWESYASAAQITTWLSQIIFPLLCLIGAVANGCSFWVTLRNRESFPRVTRQYLLIITANDFQAVTLHGCLHYIHELVNSDLLPGSLKFGAVLDIVYHFTRVYSTVGAHFFQLGLTVDRLVAVAAPMRAKQILTRWRSRVLLAGIAAFALVLPVMYTYIRVNLACDKFADLCDFRKDFFAEVYLPAELFFGRIFLLSMMTLGTISICVCIHRGNRAAGRISLHPGSSRHRQRSLVRISLMLVFINALFAVTCLPSSVTSLIVFSRFGLRKVKRPSIERLQSLIYVLFLIDSGSLNSLLYLNNALSWPVYFMSRNFYRAFCRTFIPARCRRRRLHVQELGRTDAIQLY